MFDPLKIREQVEVWNKEANDIDDWANIPEVNVSVRLSLRQAARSLRQAIDSLLMLVHV